MRVMGESLYAEGYPLGWQEKLRELWPNCDSLKVALYLSPDWETCAALLLGHYVDPIRLDQDWLRWAKREKFVALKPAVEILDA